MQFKTVKTLCNARIVEVSCSITGDLLAIIGLNPAGLPEFHPINKVGYVDLTRLARHFPSLAKALKNDSTKTEETEEMYAQAA